MCLSGYYLQFHKLENIPETNINARKSEEQIKKQLNESIINGERHKNKKLRDKAGKVEKSDEAAQIIRKFEYIIMGKNRNIIWLAQQQGKVFEKFKENAKFIKMLKQFGISKFTIIFKMNMVQLINKQPKIKNSSLSLDFLENYFKFIKKICKEKTSEFDR